MKRTILQNALNFNCRKKLTIRIVELEETITSLSQKLTTVEKQKQKLSQEIEILILDLEKVKRQNLRLPKQKIFKFI